ncbi:MAG: MBL fold metallo-hydrolase [Acidobacteriia bacterium]|nr:MBL fold metallo-hydrolase [Terriglobia bacterium]
MKIQIWGCRGSLTTPGRETLRYGGESTCIEVQSDSGRRIVVDAGSGIRKLGLSLVKERNVSHITLLLTHSHWDHLSGFPFFMPAYDPDYSITVCGGPRPQQDVWKYLTRQMEAPYFPVDFSALKARFNVGCHCDQTFCDHIVPNGDQSIQCHSIPLNHPNGGYGFVFVNEGKTFIFLTDNELRYTHEGGLPRKAYVETCRGADILFHDAQYTEEEYSRTQGWGHSTFKDAIGLAMEAGVKRLGLFHHDPERTDDDLDRELDRCRNEIAKSGSSLDCFACAEGMVIDV